MRNKNKIADGFIGKRQGSSLMMNNPEWLLQAEIAKINHLYRQMAKFGLSAEDFYNYLDCQQPQISLNIEETWEKINNDIYSRFLDGSLTMEEFRDWYNLLSSWREMICSAMDSFLTNRKKISLNCIATQKAA